MEIDPSHQKLFRSQFHQILQSFSIAQERNETREELNFHLIKEVDGDDLPNNAQNDVSFLLLNDVRVHVDDIDTDGAGRIDGQIQIFVSLEDGHVGAFVDGSLINCVRFGQVDQETEKKMLCLVSCLFTICLK